VHYFFHCTAAVSLCFSAKYGVHKRDEFRSRNQALEIEIDERGMDVTMEMPREAGPLPWVAVRSAPYFELAVDVHPGGDVQNGIFVVETKPLTQDGCSARVVFDGLRHEFNQSNTDARLKRSAIEFCNCRYDLLSDGVLWMSCTCGIDPRFYYSLGIEICGVKFRTLWAVKGNN
jgi:hypothetical protein